MSVSSWGGPTVTAVFQGLPKTCALSSMTGNVPAVAIESCKDVFSMLVFLLAEVAKVDKYLLDSKKKKKRATVHVTGKSHPSALWAVGSGRDCSWPIRAGLTGATALR